LAAVPNEPPYLAMRWWVSCGPTQPLDAGQDPIGTLRDGWLAYQRQREFGSRIGIEQMLARMAELAVRSGQQDAAADVLAEVDELNRPAGGRLTAETALLVRAVVSRDLTAARASAELARTRGHLPSLLRNCLAAATLADEPRPWLREAYDIAKPFGSPHLRARIIARMRECGMSPPRVRPSPEAFSAVELHIIELIRDGWTNRQIGVRVRMSEKTVENYLTRLFARTGCRSRVELAMAGLNGHGLGAAS
jgi:DNA-binding CsgD family transcriptional regulator